MESKKYVESHLPCISLAENHIFLSDICLLREGEKQASDCHSSKNPDAESASQRYIFSLFNVFYAHFAHTRRFALEFHEK